MRMEKTNRLTTRSHKVRDYTHMEKMHRAITRDRKDQALPGELSVWVRVLHKAQAPLVPLQDQEGTNEVSFLISEQVRRHGPGIRCFQCYLYRKPPIPPAPCQRC